MRRRVIFSPSQASDIVGLKRYVEDMLRQIIDVVNGTVEPQFNIISEEPKNPDEGKQMYASGWTSVDNVNGVFKGWNPGFDPTADPIPTQSEGDGKGLWLYDGTKWVKVG